MIDSEPGVRTNAAALDDVTKVGTAAVVAGVDGVSAAGVAGVDGVSAAGVAGVEGVSATGVEPPSVVEPPAVRSTPATDAFMTQLLGTDCEG